MQAALLDRLRRILADLRRPLIALSGGLDSRFLAHAAHMARTGGATPLLVHCRGPHIPENETASAQAFAAARDLPLRILDFDPTTIPEIRANGVKRCYFCKHALFSTFLTLRNSRWPDDPPPLCDGTNTSDLGLYRPGLQALKELGIRSPLAEAGFGKQDIREAARACGLENPTQQARPCLITRFAYDLAPTSQALVAAGRAEADIAAFVGEKENFRLRLFPPEAADSGAPLPFAAELHLERDLSPEEEARARAQIAARGFHCRAVRVIERASGTYDAAAGLSAGGSRPDAPRTEESRP